jgi:CRP/FNR family cyclic AMP-dependent transcriptional regulator
MFTIASEESHGDGYVIIKEGSPGDWVYLILSGTVEISKSVEGKKVVIELLKEGEVFGELSFLGGTKRTATATAVGDVHLGLIDRATLDAEFNKLSTDFRTILSAIVMRFEKMISRISGTLYRCEPRVPKTLSLAYKDKTSFIKAYTANISGGGVFVKTNKPLKKGEEFLLKLQLPDLPEPLKIRCEVAWARGPGGGDEAGAAGMGLRFAEMDKRDRQIIEQYIKEIIGK